jgi:hypothetical protein
MSWALHVADVKEKRNTYKVLIGRHEEKVTFGIPRHRWESNINMDIEEIGCGCGLDSSGLV